MRLFRISNILLCVLFIGICSASVVSHSGEFNRKEINQERKKLQRTLNRDKSGVGDIKVEVRMVRFLKKEFRRAKTEKGKNKYRKEVARTLILIAQMKRKHKKFSPQGRWRVEFNDGDPVLPEVIPRILHFDQHTRSTDFVNCEVLDPNTEAVLFTVSGYQRFDTVRLSRTFVLTDSVVRFDYFLKMGPIKPDHPTISGRATGRTIGDPDIDKFSVSGRRYASPF